MCCLVIPCINSIASKVAFLPPPRSYGLKCEDPLVMREKSESRKSIFGSPTQRQDSHRYKMILNDYAPWQFNDEESKCFDAFFVRTKRGKDVACLHVTCSDNAKYTILYSHPNAVDLGVMSGYLLGLGQEIECNMLGYDYAGYGCSTGKPSEENLYADVDAVYDALRERYRVPPEKIIVYGQSIGSVPTVDLASRRKVAGVVLHAAFMSGVRMVFPRKSFTVYDLFNNISKIPKISSPVLVIHGTADDIVKFVHGEKLYEKCKYPLHPLWVQGAGHNDIERFFQFLQRLKLLVSGELEKFNNVIHSRPTRSPKN